MRSSNILAKIRRDEAARICSLGEFNPAFIRLAAHFKYDAIWLDLEHRCMNNREVQALLAIAQQFEIDCLVRPATLQKTRLYRLLEDGATGLIIPNVSTPAMARELVNAVKFPPLGDRGIDGAGFDNDFLLGDISSYCDNANAETILIVQIETPEAIRNVDAIASTPGVCGLMMGPADLGLRLKHDDSRMTMDDAIRCVADAAKVNRKPWGRPVGSKDDARKALSMGAQLLPYGSDFIAIMQALEKYSLELDEVI